jgi:hypothetical protein
MSGVNKFIFCETPKGAILSRFPNAATIAVGRNNSLSVGSFVTRSSRHPWGVNRGKVFPNRKLKR